jgi:hypothetical protein
MSQETLKEETTPPVNVQQTVIQDKIQNLLIKVQEEMNRTEYQKPWYKKRWSRFTQWIDAPSKGDPPLLPPEFWDELRSPAEEHGTNQADDGISEDFSNEFYGDHWMIVVFLSLFFILAGIWLITITTFYLSGK